MPQSRSSKTLIPETKIKSIGHRLGADERFTGRGVTIAFLDAGFYAHADLTNFRSIRQGRQPPTTMGCQHPVEVRLTDRPAAFRQVARGNFGSIPATTVRKTRPRGHKPTAESNASTESWSRNGHTSVHGPQISKASSTRCP